MALTTADPICTALISQPTFSQFYIGSHVCNSLPLPLSARLSTTYSTRYLPAPSDLYMPLLLDATSILEREEVVEVPHGDDTLSTAEFATVAGRGGMLRVMILGGECALFDAVALRAYKECPAPDQEDRRRYLRQRSKRFLCISTCPPSTQPLRPTAPNLFSLFNVQKQYKFPHLPSPPLHHFVSAPLSSTCQPFIISFVRLPPPLPQTQEWVHNSADFKTKLHFSGGVENYFFTCLRPGRRTMSPLLPSTVWFPWRGHLAVYLGT